MDSESSSSVSIPPSCLSDSYGTSLRDASFSSYLNSTEEAYIHRLVKLHKVDDDELDVFSADKYFKGVIDQENSVNTAKYKQRVVKNQTNEAMISLTKIKLQPRTPRAHSASSCNSQSALLRPVERNHVKGFKKPSFLSWYCCDKRSVDVDENVEFINREYNRGIPEIIKSNFDTSEITRLNKLRLIESGIDPFVFPGSGPLKPVKKSLEVFGSTEASNDGSNRFSLEKRISLLPRGNSNESYNDDADSDASSDLFEIECLSCTVNPIEGHGPRDEVSNGNVSPTIGYAPSEVSVDWSVVTASAADFSEQGSTITSVTRPRMSTKVKPSVKTVLNKGILSGCASQKAVMVASDVYRSNEKRKSSGENQKTRKFSDSYGSMTRFHVEAKLPGHGSCRSNTPTRYDVLYN